MPASVRIGLVGYGFGGRRFHAPLIASAEGCELAGVVTRAHERRALLVQDHPGVPAFDSLADLAASGAEAVSISTPADTHIPLVREAIKLGLAVVCDKPFALDEASGREAVDAAERAGGPLTVYQNRRWDSDILTLRRLITEDAIGSVTRFESRFERFAPDRGPRPAGGGALLDFGSHLVDQALTLFGGAHRVYAELHVRETLDDDFFVAIEHRSGVRSHLWGSYLQGSPGPRLRVAGTTGTYVVEGVDGQEALLVAGRSPATEGDAWGTEPEDSWGWIRRGPEKSERVTSERGRWDSFYPAFAKAVRGEGPLPVNPRDAVEALRVLDAARTSAVSGDLVVLA
jgi:predicted dehydrogenase